MEQFFTTSQLVTIRNSRFLVTGGAGFIGSNIAHALVELGAKEVRVLDDLSTGFESNIELLKTATSFTFIKGSICDETVCREAVAGMDVVLHQAALGSVPRSIDNPIATNAVNVDGFLNMLNAARLEHTKRFIYASSSSVYGDDATMPKQEEKTGRLLSPYAVTKHTNERYAKVFADVYGMSVIGLRYFNVFGPRQNIKGPYAAVIPLFIEAMLRGERPTIFGDGKNTRDFTFVENVIYANLLAAIQPDIGSDVPVMNIAFGGTTSLNDIYALLAKRIGFAGAPNYAAIRKGDIRDSFADISLATRILGFRPVVELDKGLDLTVEWFRNA
jgi:UDP-N-acetylglucosamine/UDP-N-acetylgalactosamine 4-epimerase